MQTIAKKLPLHLQARWRDRAVKLKEKGERASFKDLVDFVVSAAESANDPVFGVQALGRNQERRREMARKGPCHQIKQAAVLSRASPTLLAQRP